MLVAYLLYPRFSALDVVGTVIDDTGLCPLAAALAIADVASADVVVVPGSDCAGDPDPALVEWPGLLHPTTTWTLSVGTGSGYLAAADALGRRHSRHRPHTDAAGSQSRPGRRPGRPAGPRVRPPTPYDAGTPAKAPAEIGELVSSYYEQRCS